MSPERLRKIETLYHSALERAPGERDAFLAEACTSDAGLASEVQSLLKENSGGLMDRPVLEAAANLLDDAPDSRWIPGEHVGPYRILGPLGEGSMGSVYKAYDSRLGREVAIKVAKEAFSGRFLREARAISALNHSHICTLFDIGPDYLVMELVEGETLARRLKKGRLSMDLVLRYGAQIADALGAAHGKGIIHRDLKPANIIVTKAGIKVLDFGLAKVAQGADSAAQADTATASQTIVGTPAYMSPEQCEGKPCDARTDIFALGLVLYEMAVGKRAFQGESQAALTAEIMRGNPSLDELPPRFAHVVERCLAKDPENRWQSARDIALQLEYQAGEARPTSEPARSKRRAWLAVAALGALTGIVLAVIPRSSGKEPLVMPLTTYPGDETSPSFSPEGSQVAFSWRDAEPGSAYHIYVKQIGPGNPVRLTTGSSDDYQPKWSPDGKWIAFLRWQPGGGSDVYLIPALGGLERKLADSTGACLDWAPDSRWLIIGLRPLPERPGGLFLLSPESGETRAFPPPSEAQGNCLVVFAPDGHALAFPVRDGGLMIQPLSDSYLPKGPPRRIPFRLGAISGLAWSADSRDLIFAYGRVGVAFGRAGVGSLWRVPASGAAAPQRLSFALNGGTPAISRRGDRMAFTRSTGEMNIWSLSLDEHGRSTGPAVKAFDSTWSEFGPVFSPDGTKVAFESDRSGNSEIYVCRADGSGCSAVTSADGVQVGSPSWSPDGKWIAFDAAPIGTHSDIDIVSSNGGKPRVLVQGWPQVVVPRWSADGNWIYFGHGNRVSGLHIYRVPVSGGKPEQITRAKASIAQPSADGKWIYFSLEADVAEASALWRMPAAGGEPTEVLHQVAGRNYALVESGIWYITPFMHESLLQFYDFATRSSRTLYAIPRKPFGGLTVSPDGRRILFTQVDQDVSSDLMLVENFR
jgi:serine/threonine protein kinase